MYIEEVQRILDKHGGYLEIVGVKAGITKIPYRLHGDYFIEIANMNKRQLKQAGNLMSNNPSAFNLALAERLKDFVDDASDEYAERAISIIDKLAELDNLNVGEQRAKEAGHKDTYIEAYEYHKAFNRYDSFEMQTLREVGDHLEAFGVRAGVTSPPYPRHDFIEILDIDKPQLKQAANLMSKNYGTFTRVVTKRLKYFAGEMGGEYAERVADVIDALAKLKRYAA
jgi:hypothetical protein